MSGIDPLKVKVGDVIEAAWDDIGPNDDPDYSCHCSFLVKVGATSADLSGRELVRVIAHDLKPGDIVREIQPREDEAGCHCDLYFRVERSS